MLKKLLDSASYFAFDSRKVKPGAIFFALKGEKHDGHTFLEKVAAQGAAGAVVSKSYQGSDFGLALYPVPDVMAALQDLARVKHAKNPPYVIGLTGTVGKTTTKEFLAALLAEKYSICKSPGSENSQASLPLILLNQKEKVDMLILEMGMSFPGEISRLTQIALPDFGFLTHISLVHSQNFEDLEGVACAKAELFSSRKIRAGVFNAKTLKYEAIRKIDCEKISYSLDEPKADYKLKREGKGIRVVEKGMESLLIHLPFTESHLLENFLGAASAARFHGVSWEEIERGAAKLQTSPHRFQVFTKNGIQIVDDSYNASPASLKAALDNLPKPKAGKKTLALLGSMKELGKFSKECHEEVAAHALPIVDYLLCLGDETEPMTQVFQKSGKAAEMVHSIEEAKERLAALAESGDVLLIKGSNSLKLWTVLL